MIYSLARQSPKHTKKVRGFPVLGGLNGPGVFRVLHPHMACNVCSQLLCATSAVVDLQHLQCPPATSGGHAPPHGREHVILPTENMLKCRQRVAANANKLRERLWQSRRMCLQRLVWCVPPLCESSGDHVCGGIVTTERVPE